MFFFFGNLTRKELFVVTSDILTLLSTFLACTGCITGVKVVFIILCFVYFFYLFCCCCCHFRCFYCKMLSYCVNLVSLIHVCWKCPLIRLLTIKKPCFSLKYAFEFMSDLGNPRINEIHRFFPHRWINVWFQLRTSICCCIRTWLLFFCSSRDRYNAEYALQFAFKKQTEQLNNNNNNNKSKQCRKM